MTNLEANKDKLKVKNAFCINAHICKYGKDCAYKRCLDCEFHGDSAKECVKAMLSEYKEPIKLTQFEHDVLKAFTKLHIYVEGDGIEDFRTLQELNRDGWFNGIENLSIKEILDNCEVIEK